MRFPEFPLSSTDDKLSFRPHIDHVCRKLSQLKCAIRHLAQFLPTELVPQIYYAYIFPHIKYGLEVYGTCSKTNLKVLQVQQNKLLKILSHRNARENTKQMYDELKLLNCESLHKLFISLFVHKQVNNKLPTIFNEYYQQRGAITSRTTRQSKELDVEGARINAGQCTIKYKGAKIWNDLPKNITEKKLK